MTNTEQILSEFETFGTRLSTLLDLGVTLVSGLSSLWFLVLRAMSRVRSLSRRAWVSSWNGHLLSFCFIFTPVHLVLRTNCRSKVLQPDWCTNPSTGSLAWLLVGIYFPKLSINKVIHLQQFVFDVFVENQLSTNTCLFLGFLS